MDIAELVHQYGPIVGLVAAYASTAGVVFTISLAIHRRQLSALKTRVAADEIAIDGLKQVNGNLEVQLGSAKKELAAREALLALLEQKHAAKEADLQLQILGKEQTSHKLTEELEKVTDDRVKLELELRARNRSVTKALKLEGQLWEKRPLAGTPRFRPLTERKMPIISVLNLKGGVGKTTVTAHLAAAFSRRGYRVLMIDLDLQGSLSSMFIPESELKRRSDDGLLMQHYLGHVVDDQKTNILDYTASVLDGQSAILGATDKLAYAELNLSMKWLLKIQERDIRFLLRRGLHQRRVCRKYDVVLLDCPPLINACCVNALAASDYLLVPVMPSRKSVERVPQLLHRFKRFHARINPAMQIAGLLYNRVRSPLVGWEQDTWNQLHDVSKDQNGLPVHGFATMIKQTAEFRDSEAAFVTPEPGTDLHEMFASLAEEFEGRLPGECVRTQKTLY